MRERVDDWQVMLTQGLDAQERDAIRRGERTERRLGSEAFVADLEAHAGRTLARQRPGPKLSGAEGR